MLNFLFTLDDVIYYHFPRRILELKHDDISEKMVKVTAAVLAIGLVPSL